MKRFFHNTNEVLDAGPSTTLTLSKAWKRLEQYVHKITWDSSLIYKDKILKTIS